MEKRGLWKYLRQQEITVEGGEGARDCRLPLAERSDLDGLRTKRSPFPGTRHLLSPLMLQFWSVSFHVLVPSVHGRLLLAKRRLGGLRMYFLLFVNCLPALSLAGSCSDGAFGGRAAAICLYKRRQG